MTTTPTANYGFSQITPGTEKDVWGPIYNASLVSIDSAIKARQTTADAAVIRAGDTMTGRLVHPASTATGIAAASMRIPTGVAPSSPVEGDFWKTAANFLVRLNGISQNIITDNYANFLVKVLTPATVAGFAGLSVPHGTAPSSPVNGDIWSTTAGLFARINGTSVTFSIVGHTHAQSDITNLTADLALLAPKASPVFTGTPTAPTAAANTNTTQLATTAFVQQEKLTQLENLQTVSYTLVAADAGKLVAINNASANNWTVPPNSSVPFPLNTRIDGAQYGAGKTTIVAGAGVTLRAAGARLGAASQYSGWSIMKRATDEWWVFGDLV